MLGKTGTKDVIKAWKKFFQTYKKFRKDNGLGNSTYNGFEICTALSDKHGRICRQVKHQERNDPKKDWPVGMTEAMAGYLIYMEMLLERFGCDMCDGFLKEMESALKQYQDKDDKTNEPEKKLWFPSQTKVDEEILGI